MTARVILLAGPIAVGKTAVAEHLAGQGACHIRVRLALADLLNEHPDDREALQRGGSELDRRTSGLWLRNYVLDRTDGESPLVVDSLRTVRQTEPMLTIPNSALIYLRASDATRRQRYELSASNDEMKRRTSYDITARHPAEMQVTDLIPLASEVLDTDSLTVGEVADLIPIA